MSILTDFTTELDNVAANSIQTAPQNPLLNGVDNAAMLSMAPTPEMQMNADMLPAAQNAMNLEASLAERMPYTAAALEAQQQLEHVMKPAGFA